MLVLSQGLICSDNCMCCNTETEIADQTFYLTKSQYTDTRPASLSTDPITPGAWLGSHWSANFQVTGMTRPRKILAHAGLNPRSSALEENALTTMPIRQTRGSGQEVGDVSWLRTVPATLQICLNNCICCHTETDVVHQTFYLVQSPYTDTRLNCTDPVPPGT